LQRLATPPILISHYVQNLLCGPLLNQVRRLGGALDRRAGYTPISDVLGLVDDAAASKLSRTLARATAAPPDGQVRRVLVLSAGPDGISAGPHLWAARQLLHRGRPGGK